MGCPQIRGAPPRKRLPMSVEVLKPFKGLIQTLVPRKSNTPMELYDDLLSQTFEGDSHQLCRCRHSPLSSSFLMNWLVSLAYLFFLSPRLTWLAPIHLLASLSQILDGVFLLRVRPLLPLQRIVKHTHDACQSALKTRRVSYPVPAAGRGVGWLQPGTVT